jgi:hypothetical protein
MENDSYANENDLFQPSSLSRNSQLPSVIFSSLNTSSIPSYVNHQSRVDTPVEHTLPGMNRSYWRIHPSRRTIAHDEEDCSTHEQSSQTSERTKKNHRVSQTGKRKHLTGWKGKENKNMHHADLVVFPMPR